MVGTAGLLALWILSATNPATASDVQRPDDAVIMVAFREAITRADASETIAPAPTPPKSDGIRGLPPLPGETKPSIPRKLPPAESKPDEFRLPPASERPFAEPESDDGYDNDIGKVICTDDGLFTPCDGIYSPCPRRVGWLDGIYVDSWLDQGVTINTLSPRNRINGPVTFNDRSNAYQLNQMYLRLARDAAEECDRWGMGGCIDLLYGTDSIYTAARGLEVTDDLSPRWNAQRYGLAMPQLYAEFYCPWGNGLNMKIGHFYSILGYESVAAPDNFFYSHSYLFQYAAPFTFTGFLGETHLGDFTIQAGMTRGDDNWDDNNNDLGVVGNIGWTSRNGRTNIALGVDATREQPDPSSNIRTIFSLVIQQKLGRHWQYVIQSDIGNEPGAGVGNPTTLDRATTASWYGVNQYLFRTINERWQAGMRFEWFRDENGSRVPGANRTGDYFELSTGVNWTPNKHITLRPELRWDWTGTADYYPFGDGTRSNQVLLNCDLIVRF